MKLLIAILVALTQMLCACAAAPSLAAAKSPPPLSVESHQSHGPHETSPCNGNDGHCYFQSVAITKHNAASKTASPFATVAKTPVVLPDPNARIIQIRAPTPSKNTLRRLFLPLLIPLKLKVRFLN